MDTKGEILSKEEQMDLNTTVAFVEVRETGKRDLVQLGGCGTLASKASLVQVQGKCLRCVQAGHNGKAPPAVRKTPCKAF